MADVATRKPIPLVNNIIPDGALNTLNFKETNSAITVEGTLKLLTDRHSEKLVDRHVRSIKRLTQQFKKGFLIKDICAVGHLIAACAGRVEKDLAYEKPLCDILKVCRNPLLKERSSDESNFSGIVTEFITELGNLMYQENAAVQVQVARALTKFYSSKGSQTICIGVEPTSAAFNKSVVEKSGAVQAVVKCLGRCRNFDVKMELMTALQCFSHSAINCDDMLPAGAARIVCSGLADSHETGRGMFLSVDILWNMLHNGSKIN
ncbi:cilia- and flagella-associated 69-like, partial [Paramuricea clavata]